jgi:hypothetical protein
MQWHAITVPSTQEAELGGSLEATLGNKAKCHLKTHTHTHTHTVCVHRHTHRHVCTHACTCKHRHTHIWRLLKAGVLRN